VHFPSVPFVALDLCASLACVGAVYIFLSHTTGHVHFSILTVRAGAAGDMLQAKDKGPGLVAAGAFCIPNATGQCPADFPRISDLRLRTDPNGRKRHRYSGKAPIHRHQGIPEPRQSPRALAYDVICGQS